MIKRIYLILFLINLCLSSFSFAQEFATLYIYRVKKLSATGKDFKIYLNNLEIAQIPNGGRLEYHLYNQGKVKIMVGIFSEYMPKADNYDNNLTLDIQKGQTYYLKGEGNSLVLVDSKTGKSEFERHSNFKGEIATGDNKPLTYTFSEEDKRTSESKPPRIIFTEPFLKDNEPFQTNSESLVLRGTIGSSVGIKGVYINNEEAVLNKDGDFTAVVSLVPGTNKFILTAQDELNLSSTFSILIERIPLDAQANQPEETLYRGSADPLKGINVNKDKAVFQTGNYYALIVGVDKYKGVWNPLVNAVNDAKAVEATLRNQYRIDKFRTLYNEQASRSAIINELEWLVANVKENDNVFIYYSGHGEFKNELNKGYWVPADATSKSVSQYISNSEIQTFISGIRSKHTLLVTDACFSGDIFRGNTVSVPFENSEKYYTNVYKLASRQAISSGGIEPVMDGGRDGHSVFTYYFLQTLQKNQNKYLDSGQLFEKIKIPIINNSDQTPKFSPLKNTGDEGGHFIFIKK